MLDDTLVIWGGEFGRTPTVELPTPGANQGKMNGRDHNHYGFTMWMAGGGVKGGHVHGATDEFGFQAVAGQGPRPRPPRHHPPPPRLRPRDLHLPLRRPRLPPHRRPRPGRQGTPRLSGFFWDSGRKCVGKPAILVNVRDEGRRPAHHHHREGAGHGLEARSNASRANGLRSKGPTSARGKETSRQNSLKHGMAGRGASSPSKTATRSRPAPRPSTTSWPPGPPGARSWSGRWPRSRPAWMRGDAGVGRPGDPRPPRRRGLRPRAGRRRRALLPGSPTTPGPACGSSAARPRGWPC